MNVLFIHEVDWIEKLVFDIHFLAEGISLRGHNVYAIDYEDTWGNHSPGPGHLKAVRIDNVSRAFPGSSVSLTHPGFIRIPGLSRISAAFTHYLEIRRIVSEKKIDAIVLYSVPTNGIQAVKIAQKFNIPVIFRSIDILNQMVPFAPLRPVTKALEKIVYSKADMILTLTPGLTKYVVELGADESRVKTLLMPVDTDIFYPYRAPDELRGKWGLGDTDRVILFMGTLFDFSGLDDFIPRFGKVLEVMPDARLLIVGDGPQRNDLETLIREMDLREKVIITGFEPYEMMPQYINMASICINTFRITDTTRDIFPGKTVQFLACGKPFISTSLPGMLAVIDGEEQGIVYADDPEDVIEVTISLLGSEDKRKALGKAGVEYVKRTHSFESIARQLEEAIQEAVERK